MNHFWRWVVGVYFGLDRFGWYDFVSKEKKIVRNGTIHIYESYTKTSKIPPKYAL